jgi:hypothetical protein
MAEKQFNVQSILSKFIAGLPAGHSITGFTFETSFPIGKGHVVRANGGTYKELFDTFEGDEDAFVSDMQKGYEESVKIGLEKFTPIVNEEEGRKGGVQ